MVRGIIGQEVGAITTNDVDLRERALARLQKKREFKAHVFAYVLVNTFVVAIWAVTGSGFFWPIFPILGWGIGLFFHGWDVYQGPLTEQQIQEEMHRIDAPR